VSTGHPLIIGVVLDTVDAVDLCRTFAKMSHDAGFDVPISSIPFFRYFYVAETEEQAKKDTGAALKWTMDMNQWRRTFQHGSEVYQKMEDWRRERTELPTSNEHLYNRRAIIGTPEQCVDQIKELQSNGIEYFGCNFSFGGMEQGKLLRSMRLFADEVMPHFN
jgi:alkanesulfonate monooxygenase SsuD/methylene tetrahydromethanopterin reductase-like flavin-dependent oxidoreductase (luciferase family)